MMTTPVKPTTSPPIALRGVCEPNASHANNTVKKGAVLVSTAALPGPASLFASAMPSKVSETVRIPEMAPTMSVRRSRGRRPRTRPAFVSSPRGIVVAERAIAPSRGCVPAGRRSRSMACSAPAPGARSRPFASQTEGDGVDALGTSARAFRSTSRAFAYEMSSSAAANGSHRQAVMPSVRCGDVDDSTVSIR